MKIMVYDEKEQKVVIPNPQPPGSKTLFLGIDAPTAGMLYLHCTKTILFLKTFHYGQDSNYLWLYDGHL